MRMCCGNKNQPNFKIEHLWLDNKTTVHTMGGHRGHGAMLPPFGPKPRNILVPDIDKKHYFYWNFSNTFEGEDSPHY